MKLYKIRDNNGMYSTGGTSPSFNKAGKTWNNIGHVKSHLRQFMGGNDIEMYRDCEVVCVEVSESDVDTYDMLNFFESLNQQSRDDYENSNYKSEYTEKRLDRIDDKIKLMRLERENEAK